MSDSKPEMPVWRSLLYVPVNVDRFVDKAHTRGADGIILDLEDAVAPDAKEMARQQIVDAVKEGGYGKRELILRVNALSTPWGYDDLVAAATSGVDAVLLRGQAGFGGLLRGRVDRRHAAELELLHLAFNRFIQVIIFGVQDVIHGIS